MRIIDGYKAMSKHNQSDIWPENDVLEEMRNGNRLYISVLLTAQYNKRLQMVTETREERDSWRERHISRVHDLYVCI